MIELTMTIKLASAIKEETEDAILKAIEKFERETNTIVDDIRFLRPIVFKGEDPIPPKITIKAMIP